MSEGHTPLFGNTGDAGDQLYVKSASWPKKGKDYKHTFKDLLNSDHLEFKLDVGSSSWTWKQDYLYDADGDKDPAEADWLSDIYGNDGAGTAPLGLVSASSLQWNLNNSTWDITLGGTRTKEDKYKSPDTNTINDVTDDGYPIYSSEFDWEWPLVYEMSIDLSGYSGQGFSMTVKSAHNSPSKDNESDVPINLYDFGDALDSYGTTEANGGPSHKIILGSGPRLGSLIDAEPDGQPTATADGDDVNGSDDEDGLISISTLTPGSTGSIVVTGTAGAKLDAWIDFNADGDFLDVGEQIAGAATPALSGGNDTITFDVPDGAVFDASSALRLRVSTAGDLPPHGPADDGEVEDYTLTASIGDYVWLDINEDGIQDAATEGGINNVTVELYDDSGSGIPVADTTTADGGAYLFSGLVPGQYYVKFYLRDSTYEFSPQNAVADPEADSDADTTTGETVLITLSPGENDLSWDCGMFIPATLVTLSSFGADVVDGQVVVSWETSSELNSAGFFLERLDEQSGEYVRVNANLIPASIFSTGTVDYETVDAGAVVGESYKYRLVEIETTGAVNTYGPYTVSTEAPAVSDDAATGGAAAEQVEQTPPAVSGLTAGSGHMALRWTSVQGKTYRIERSDSVNGDFEVIASGIPATAPENILFLVDLADSGFYRIVSE